MHVGDSLLEHINSPRDIKSLTGEELERLAREIREVIIGTTQEKGGHLASNLGTVELTLALHRVFDSPRDKIIWDVGHQAYTHKLLTGRREAFSTLRQLEGISGFPRREESDHDITDPGHASTALSSGIGINKGQEIAGIEGHVVAVVGDGSLTGGLTLEALNFTGHIPNNLIVLLNDNSMSIDKNVGAISSHLSRLAATSGYLHFSRTFDRISLAIPVIGKPFYRFYSRLKKVYKSLFYRDGLFTELGFKYIGPMDGHNRALIEKVLHQCRELNKPCVVHLKTIKGRGLESAEGNPSGYHGLSPRATGSGGGEKLTAAFSRALLAQGERDGRITAVTAAMKEGTGLAGFAEQFPRRFFDVGIAESHGVTFAAGMAIAGLKPVVAIYSTFMQRAVDQVIHDVAIPGLPVVFVLDRAGLIPGDGETHQGIFDLALFRSVPGLTVLAPAASAEIALSLEWALRQDRPVMIRYSKMESPRDNRAYSLPIEAGRGVYLRKTERKRSLLIITLGGLADQVLEAAGLLEKEAVGTDVYNLRFATGLDREYLKSLISSYELTVFIEEGVKEGGIGESLGAYLIEEGVHARFMGLAVPNVFPPAATREELIRLYGLDSQSLFTKILLKWQSYRFEKVVDQVRNDTWEGRKL